MWYGNNTESGKKTNTPLQGTCGRRGVSVDLTAIVNIGPCLRTRDGEDYVVAAPYMQGSLYTVAVFFYRLDALFKLVEFNDPLVNDDLSKRAVELFGTDRLLTLVPAGNIKPVQIVAARCPPPHTFAVRQVRLIHFQALVRQCPRMRIPEFIKAHTGVMPERRDGHFVLHHGTPNSGPMLLAPGSFATPDPMVAARYFWPRSNQTNKAYRHEILVPETAEVFDISRIYTELRTTHGASNAGELVAALRDLGVLEEIDGVAILGLEYQSIDEFVLVNWTDVAATYEYTLGRTGAVRVQHNVTVIKGK